TWSGFSPGVCRWSCRESNPGPPPPREGFSVCSSLRLYLDLPFSRTRRDDDPSRCLMSRTTPRPSRTVELPSRCQDPGQEQTRADRDALALGSEGVLALSRLAA